MARIDVMSSCLVGMASNAASMSRLELTPWDLQSIPFFPIQTGILFHKPQSQEIDENFIDHLRNSLSRTLDFFPPLAGRLGTIENDDNTMCYFVDCNNAGAEFTHAVAADVSISDILEPKYIPEIVFSFFPLNGARNIEGVSKPLVGVQVTELIDGLFLGCTANHVVVDGTSFWHFFNSWSEISRGFDTISKSPVLEPWFPPNVTNDSRLIRLPTSVLKQHPLQKFGPPRILDRVFHFSKESLAKLKSKANFEAATHKISTFQALSALVWRAIIRCQDTKNIHNLSSREVDFILIVGARARIPLPDGYFGNAVYGATTTTSEAELLQNGIGYAALKINELVAQQTSEAAIKYLEERVKNPTTSRKSSAIFVMIKSAHRDNVYGNDFGWGKPIAVRSGKALRFDEKITISPVADPGGVDLEVCLAPEKMQAVEYDAEFMESVTI